jgi:exodeoxyribonuclease VII large subunit
MRDVEPGTGREVTASPAAWPVVPVSLLVSSARLLIERHLGLAWISGEVSNLTRAASGHAYFLLKDAQAQVRCVLFRHKAQLLGFALQDGMQVEVRATPTIYEARGEFQLNVETVRHAGVGALYEQFARLKARLEAAGWFAPERKRPLPRFPRAVGVVTSLRAAALADVLTTLGRRMPSLGVILYPAAVQGSGAAAEVAAAIAVANARAEVDVLIVCRGGGSIEDLWAFNEEALARAVLDSRLPVVSGVGHETDFTICDFVADVRAPTPTAAAALVAAERAALLVQVAALVARWRRAAERALETRMQRVDGVSRRLVHPAERLAAQRQRLEAVALRLTRAAAAAQAQRERALAVCGQVLARLLRAPPRGAIALERLRERWQRAASDRVGALAHRLGKLELGLRHLSPQGVLERGYSIVTTDSGVVVQDATQTAVGAALRLRFARGAAEAKVTRKTTG